MMKKVITVLFLSCKKATELTEKQNVTELAAIERIQLWMHNSMCKACSSYARQSAVMNKALRKWVDKKEKPKKVTLPEEVRKEIIKEIEEDQKN